MSAFTGHDGKDSTIVEKNHEVKFTASTHTHRSSAIASSGDSTNISTSISTSSESATTFSNTPSGLSSSSPDLLLLASISEEYRESPLAFIGDEAATSRYVHPAPAITSYPSSEQLPAPQSILRTPSYLDYFRKAPQDASTLSNLPACNRCSCDPPITQIDYRTSLALLVSSLASILVLLLIVHVLWCNYAHAPSLSMGSADMLQVPSDWLQQNLMSFDSQTHRQVRIND